MPGRPGANLWIARHGVQPWDAIHRVADKAFPALRTLFTQAFTAFREAIDWTALGTLLVQGNLPGVLVLLEQAWAESTDAGLRDPLRALTQQIVAQSAEASQPALAAVLPRAAGLAITFDATSPHVIAFVQDHSATLIRGIGEETRQAIRAMLVQNMQAGRSWRSLVPEMQQMIGVTVRQADALVALRTRLGDSGMQQARIDQLIAQKTRAYIRLRARTISRHESLLAANSGQHLLLQQMVSDGVMDPTQYKRFVVITPDERLCAICRGIKAQNAQGVGLLQPFQTPTGSQMFPPFHVTCRCTSVTRAVRRMEGPP